MRDLTEKEMESALKIVKQPQIRFSANSLSVESGTSAMGSLKILNRLAEEGVVVKEQIGRAGIYNINDDEYAKQFMQFLLAREAKLSAPIVKRWIKELQKLQNAQMILLFGSVLHKEKPNDIDVLLVVDSKNVKKV